MRGTIRLMPLVLLALLTWVLSGCDSDSPEADRGQSPSPSTSAAPSQASGTLTPSPSEQAHSDIVAKVGAASITRDQLSDRLTSQYGRQMLRELMLAEAMEQEADSLSLTVTETELEQELLDMRQGYDSEEQFYGAMQEQLGMSREDVRKEARYRLLTEKLSVRNVEVTEEEIDGYIADHPELTTPRRYYDIAQIVVDDEETARQLLSQLEGGAAFGAVAERYSLDDFTAEYGGELGWIDERDPFTDPEILKHAAKMEVGQITGPIETASGYVILALNGFREEEPRKAEEIRNAAMRDVALGKAEPIKSLEQWLLEKYHAQVLDASLQ
ncbi:peptidylprolyl isomerase [Cohnella panacarvi]|uniref:peptidylprolyl isomerase n=1 Tax=Cohnella panacarvi TaxID=400776 RepID=UPI00047D5948|nr:peptidylprolyl isomerase [Cohnella panacarvi]